MGKDASCEPVFGPNIHILDSFVVWEHFRTCFAEPDAEQMRSKVLKCGRGEENGNMTYTVVAFKFGVFDSLTLKGEIIKRQLLSQLWPKMKIATIDSIIDIQVFSSRFGDQYLQFYLFNDFALQTCREMGYPVAPPGEIVGTIDDSEVAELIPIF